MNEIMHHEFLYEQMNQPNVFKHKVLKKISKVLPKMPTKASKLRDTYLKQTRDDVAHAVMNDNKNEWKLRQFLGVGASEDIVKSIKLIRKRQNKSVIPAIQPYTNNDTLPKLQDPAPEGQKLERIDKKVKDRLLNDYFSEKRSMSSKRSQH